MAKSTTTKPRVTFSGNNGLDETSVVVVTGQVAVALTVDGVPENGSVRICWLLRGGYKKPAEPSHVQSGRTEVLLHWRTATRLLDDCLVVDVWSPVTLSRPPTLVAAGAASASMRSSASGQRFTHQLRLKLQQET